MKTINENLSELFNIEPMELEKSVVATMEETQESNTAATTITDVESDTEFARKNIRELIQKGKQAMDNLLVVAKESEHPRAYEVASGLIKNLSDLNKDLLDIQKKKRELLPQQNQQVLNVDKAVFVGSTTELVKLIKNKQQ